MSLQLVVLRYFHLAASECLPIDAAKDYQYLQMVYQWPPAFCRHTPITCNPNPPKHFTIHGLWPSNWTQQANSFPRIDCLGVLFNDTKLMGNPHPPDPTLISDLKANWPSLKLQKGRRSVNLEFWRHEYNDHGRCMDNLFNGDQNEYFRKAIRFSRQDEIIKWLQGVTIKNPIQLQDLVAAIRKYTKTNNIRPLFVCDENNSGNLKEVRICYDHDGTSRVNCDPLFPIGAQICPPQIIL